MEIGARIDRYVIEAEFGSGGFGSVYRARHTVIDRPVALKVLRRDREQSDALRERFLQEARAAAGAGSPHIVQVLDAGITAEGQAFLAMELLEGEDLASRIERRGRLSPGEAITLGRQILSGLADAHARGIVHRDLKPANVFLARAPDGSDVAKILDFGISKMRGPNRLDGLTKTGMVLGTPCYMAPEQFRGAKDVDWRADLYSCAVILYEMLSGKLPHDAESYESLILRIFSEPPVPLLRTAPDVPTSLAYVVERGLARDPDARWQTAEDMAAALDAAERGDSPLAAVPPTSRVDAERDTGPLTDPRAFAATGYATAPSGAPSGPPSGAQSTPPTRIAAETPRPSSADGPATVPPRRGGPGRWIALVGGGVLLAALAAGGVTVLLSAVGGSDAPPGPVTLTPANGPSTPGPGGGAPIDPPKPPVDPPPDRLDEPAVEHTPDPPPRQPAGRVDPPESPPGGRDEPAAGDPSPPPSSGTTRVRTIVEVLGNGIPHDDAQRVVDRAVPRMQRCRDDVERRVRAQMLVGLNGTINIAQPDPNREHGHTDTARCVAQAIRASGPVANTEMGGIFYADVTLPPR